MSIRVSAQTRALSGTFALGVLIAACSSRSPQPSVRGSGDGDAGSDFGIGASDSGGPVIFRIPGDPEGFLEGTSSATFDGFRIEAKIAVQNVAPGDEEHACVIVELPTESDVWVKEVDATLSGGSHHLIADRSAPGTPAQQNPRTCFPTTASDATRLMIAQQQNTQILLPTGAA